MQVVIKNNERITQVINDSIMQLINDGIICTRGGPLKPRSLKPGTYIYGPGSGQGGPPFWGGAQDLGPGFWFICVLIDILPLKLPSFFGFKGWLFWLAFSPLK